MRNYLKILSLGVGLAMGLVLSSKVFFEQTFDNCYADAERIVYINEVAEQKGRYTVWAQTSGGWAPRMAEYFPEVETATRFIYGGSGFVYLEDSKERVNYNLSLMVDSLYSSIFTTDVVAGDVKKALSTKGQAAVSMSFARKLYRGTAKNDKAIASELIGRRVRPSEQRDSSLFTISAVYHDYPYNASWRPEMLTNFKSITSFFGYDGTENMIGNDMYRSFVKLRKGVSIEELNKKMPQFCEDNLDMDMIREAGYEISAVLKPLANFHGENSGTANMIYLLAFVAFTLIVTSVLNYLLAVVSTSVTRGKEMAVRKCYGAGRKEVYAMMMREAVLHTFFALVIAVILIFAFRGTIEELSGSSLGALFTGRPLLLAIGIVIVVTLVNGLLPSELFQRIPVAVAFRNYRENKRAWKLALLSIEFVAVAFLLVSLTTISMQYSKLTSADMGFDIDNVSMIEFPEATHEQKLRLMDELRKLPCIDDACFAYQSPFKGYSGDNVGLLDSKEELFNFKNAFFVDSHYANVMGLKIVAGRNFNPDKQAGKEVLVDQKFVETMRKTAKIDDVVGRHFRMTSFQGIEGGPEVVGVFQDIKTGAYMSQKDEDLDEDRAMVMFFWNPAQNTTWYRYIFVKHKPLSAESMTQVQAVIDRVLVDQNAPQTAFKQLMLENYTATRNTRNTVLIGGIITLLIALTGLIGYTIDEVRHRRKEIAIRRVNGAQMSEVRIMFIKSIMKIALPTVFAGCILALYAMEKWQQQFSISIGMPWWQAIIAGSFTLGIIAIITGIYVNRYAGYNPANSLRAE